MSHVKKKKIFWIRIWIINFVKISGPYGGPNINTKYIKIN